MLPSLDMGKDSGLILYSSMLYNIRYMGAPIKTNKNIMYQTAYHVVWCTKYRRDVLDDAVQLDLKAICLDVASERQAEIIAIETVKDHVHLVINVAPQYGIHKLVKQMKGRTSREIRKKYLKLRTRLPTLWTNSYFVATVGGVPLEAVKEYV